MPATYDKIASQTLGSNQASYTFTSIPSTYTDLILVYSGSLSSGVSPTYWFNNDSGNNYSATTLSGNGSAANSARLSNFGWGSLGAYFGGVASGNEIMMQLQVFNYANTTTNKTAIARMTYPAGFTEATVSLWRSTSAINSITINGYAGGGSYATGSTFTLYGIKAA